MAADTKIAWKQLKSGEILAAVSGYSILSNQQALINTSGVLHNDIFLASGTLQTGLNTLSGFGAANYPILDVSGQPITGAFELSGISNLVVMTSGGFILFSGVNTGNFLTSSQTGAFLTSGNLTLARVSGSSVISGQITWSGASGISPVLTNPQNIAYILNGTTLTGLRVTGSNTLVGLVNFTGVGGTNVQISGNNILISGGAAAASTVGGVTGVGIEGAAFLFTGGFVLSGKSGIVLQSGNAVNNNWGIQISQTAVSGLGLSGDIFQTGQVFLSGAGGTTISRTNNVFNISSEVGGETTTNNNTVVVNGNYQHLETQRINTIQNSITFFPIPQNYTNLKIIGSSRGNVSTSIGIYLRFNNDSATNYHWILPYTVGSTALQHLSGISSTGIYVGNRSNVTSPSNHFSNTETNIPFYSSLDFIKEINGRWGEFDNFSNPCSVAVGTSYGLWNNSGAVTGITLVCENGSFVTGSTFSLFAESTGVNSSGLMSAGISGSPHVTGTIGFTGIGGLSVTLQTGSAASGFSGLFVISGGASSASPYIGCRVYSSSGFTLANNTLTPVPFDSEEWDTHSFHDTAASSRSKITIPVGQSGIYQMNVMGNFAQDADGHRFLGIRLTGVTFIVNNNTPAAPDDSTDLTLSATHILKENDYIELIARHTAGANLTFQQTFYYPTLTITKLGTL